MHRLRGTDADPYDPNRGMLYRYIGWYLMHKTPKMIEALGAGPDAVDLEPHSNN